MSSMASDKQAGTFVKPTAGPIANVARLLSRENAGLSVVPSDMLLYTARSEQPRLRIAKNRLRFIMTIGRKVVHVIARKDIRRLEDLDGKRVVMGPDNTALWVVSSNLLHMHGVAPSERIQLKPPAGITAVLTSQADAVFVIGDAPMGVVQKLSALRQTETFGPEAKQVHMLAINLPASATEYRPVTVNYPGFAENLETVAILPTLVSYDFTHKSSPYFRRRCAELGRIGRTVHTRLKELRASGHKQWRSTTWELEAGNWEKDSCFFSGADEHIVSEARPSVNRSSQGQFGNQFLNYRRDVREAQQILKRLGYNIGIADGLLGPRTSAGLRRFQADQNMTPSGIVNIKLLSLLRSASRQKN
ncbi:MAG: TAXI family TRAP transporter solute-binding subunit [Hyphomicrobiaceae bacterium]